MLDPTLLQVLAYDKPIVWNLPEENSAFVGRVVQLKHITSNFKRKNQNILALTGGPGFGKTQTAKQFAQDCHTSYDLIWWFDANQDIPNQFKKLAIELNELLPKNKRITPSALSKDALINTIKTILQTQHIKWLMVFDNIESYDRIKQYVPEIGSQRGKHILLTSRNASIWSELIEIGKFDRSESLQFLKKILPHESEEHLNMLAEKLGDYPLGLTIAAAFIKTHPPVTILKYISHYLSQTIKGTNAFLHISDPLLEGYASNVQGPLSISLNSIASHSQEALKVLRFMSLLNSQDIPEDYIGLWLKHTKGKTSADEVMKIISDQSLITIATLQTKQKGKTMRSLSMHDLIHQLIQENIPVKEKQELIDSATAVMLEVLEGSSTAFTLKVTHDPIHLLHAQKLCERAKEIGYTSPALLTLKICLLQCLKSATRDLDGAQLIRNEIETDFKNNILVPAYYEAIFEYNRGFLEAVLTHFPNAIQHMQKALTLFETSGDHKNDILATLSNLAQYHILWGDLEQAEPLLYRAKAMLKESSSVAATGTFLYAFPLLLLDQGKFQEAEEVLRQADAYPTLNKDSPTGYHGILLLMTTTLLKQKKLSEVQKILQNYEKTTNIFFQGRPNTALSNILLLKSLFALEKGENSPKIFQDLEKAFSIYREFFKGDKRQKMQARTYFAIGKTHYLRNEFDKALENYLTSDEVYGIILKNKRIDDVSELYKELSFLGVAMKKDDITSKYLKAHIETFGLDHPRTLEIIMHLDEEGLGIPF